MRPVLVMLAALLLATDANAQPAGFQLPSSEARAAAAGDLSPLPEVLKRALDPASALFEPIETPGPHDWLANHPEPGQTFEQFLRSHSARPSRSRGTLCFQPMGDFAGEEAPSLAKLSDFAAAFFGLKVAILPRVALGEVPAKTRINRNTQKPQMLSPEVLRWLARRLPGDGFCIIAITMTDLYPDESWNFVFGQASLSERTGVFSFARYDPAFFGGARDASTSRIVLERAAKVLAHETGHMFGIRHCIFYRCLMNGSNHLDEADSRPFHLCPVCLRKLHSATGFDVVKREERLREFFKANDFSEAAAWSEKRLEELGRR
jgi:archaemetzincin